MSINLGQVKIYRLALQMHAPADASQLQLQVMYWTAIE